MRYLDELDGQIVYRSHKFDLSCDYLARQIEEGKTLTIDFSSLEIKYRKRANQTISEPSSSSQEHGETNDDHDTTYDTIISLIPSVVEVLRNMDRADDFISVLDSLSKGVIEHNIALHLLLDVGKFLRQNTVTTMRYGHTLLPRKQGKRTVT